MKYNEMLEVVANATNTPIAQHQYLDIIEILSTHLHIEYLIQSSTFGERETITHRYTNVRRIDRRSGSRIRR